MVYVYSPSTQEERGKKTVSLMPPLGYIVNSRPTWATEQYCLKIKKKVNNIYCLLHLGHHSKYFTCINVLTHLLLTTVEFDNDFAYLSNLCPPV
jgi:hypothetical protein